MQFTPYIKSRKEYLRNCACGVDHQIKIIRGMFHYSDSSHTAFCVALIENQNERHIWVSFITGEWPGTNKPDCFVTSHIWSDTENRVMKIENSAISPFTAEDTFDSYPVTRDQVLAQEGAKEWFIKTYLELFEIDTEIGGYIE